jgi:hypothetical protein
VSSLQSNASRFSNYFFIVHAKAGVEGSDTEIISDAIFDDGSNFNAVSPEFASHFKVPLAESSIVAKSADQGLSQSLEKITLSIRLRDADENFVETANHVFEVLPKLSDPILFGRPFKVDTGIIQFYELDTIFIPVWDSPSELRQWARFHPRNYPPSHSGLPATPLEAVRLLTMAQPYVSIEELEKLESKENHPSGSHTRTRPDA